MRDWRILKVIRCARGAHLLCMQLETGFFRLQNKVFPPILVYLFSLGLLSGYLVAFFSLSLPLTSLGNSFLLLLVSHFLGFS